MTKDQIKELALANGFKLKEQLDGQMDLDPYVYEFASAVFAKGVITVYDDILTDLDANEDTNIMSSVIFSVQRHTSILSDTNKKLLEKLANDANIDSE